ncbi:hypothetical protein ABN028_16095 [Actinopolymorpha sp. B17G11]
MTDAFRWEWAIDQLDGHDDEQEEPRPPERSFCPVRPDPRHPYAT